MAVKQPNKKKKKKPFHQGLGGLHPSKGRLPKMKRGRPKGVIHPCIEDVKVLEVDVEMVKRYLSLNFHNSITELRKKFLSEDLSFGEASIVSVMLRIYDTGDIYALNALYDRMIGPVLRRIHMTGERPFAEWEWDKLVEEKHRLTKQNRHTLEMIEKERKLIALVESGDIKPGEYTEAPSAKESDGGLKSYVFESAGNTPPSTDKASSS